jgi:nitrate reductase NapE component
MDGKSRQILNGVVVVAVVLWPLQAFGIIGSLRGITVR